MAKKRDKRPVLTLVPDTVAAYDRQAHGVTVNEAKVITAPVEQKATQYSIQGDILSTPAPWTQEWLDIHSLQVLYKHGRAVLQFKE